MKKKIKNDAELISWLSGKDIDSKKYEDRHVPEELNSKVKKKLKNKLIKNNNEKITNNKNINDNKDIEFYQNEQILNGYASDFTKKIYYQREIKNKVLVFSDNEDEIYLKKKTHRKKQKITRIKANEPIIIREKDKNKIKNYNDFVVIGMESAYIDKNIGGK